MDKWVLLVGRASAAVGVALTVFSILARLAGRHFVGTFESATLLDGGVAAMVLACLAYLFVMAEGRRRHHF